MSFLEKILRKDEGVDVEEVLNNLDATDESFYEDADAFVKPVTLSTETDRDLAMSEVKKGNLILLNIADLSKRNALKVRDLVGDIKSYADSINGDIARISNDHVLITPANVKIIKRRATSA